MSTVLLAGATGYIGVHVAAELSGAGYTVLCPVRAAASTRSIAALRALPGVTVVATAPCDPRALARDLSTAPGEAPRAVVSCLASRGGGPADSWTVDHGANANLLAWALAHDVQHFTLLSAICVQRPKLQFQFAKARFEAELATSGLRYSIVRPTAYFKSLCGQVERVRRGKPFLVFGDGELTACKPIGERDLARYLRRTLEEPELQGRVLPVGGPGPALTPRQQGELLARLAGRPLRLRHVSPRLFRAAAAILDVGARVVPALADKAEFARIGHYYATESMLVWDAERHCYDAQGTPSYGEATLEACYRALLADNGGDPQRLGEHALFARRHRE